MTPSRPRPSSASEVGSGRSMSPRISRVTTAGIPKITEPRAENPPLARLNRPVPPVTMKVASKPMPPGIGPVSTLE